MKKLLLVLLIVICLVGCGKNEALNDNEVVLVAYLNDDVETVDLRGFGAYKIDIIKSYAVSGLRNIKRIYLSETIQEIEQYALYGLYNIKICYDTTTRPNNWNNLWSNCNSISEYYNYDFTRQIRDITITSGDLSIVYDGNYHSTSESEYAVNGELAEGDYISYNYTSDWWGIGTRECWFDCNIYDANGNNVSVYYNITKVYGTITIYNE